MKVNFKKIIKSTHITFGKDGFGVRSSSKRDLMIVSFLALVLIIISGFYSFRLFSGLEVSNDFFSYTSGEVQAESVIDIEKLKEKLELFNTENGCLVEFEETISSVSDPSF